ncbi:MAG: NAD-binding protein [Candidatus Methanofastidiosa archaeon]|nr:NAD-binding protein [Candidatus Methanofastidiosa archaeon]
MYLILGSGLVSYAIANILKDRDQELYIIEKDPKKVRDLLDRGFSVVEGDFFSPSAQVQRVIEKARVSFVMTNHSDINLKLIDHISELNPESYIIARGFSVKDLDELKHNGADVVVIPQAALAEQAINSLDSMERLERVRGIKGALTKGERLGIILHDNPDPDSIASGMALKLIAESRGLSCDILYGGEIGHQQNKVFVNLLNIDLIHIDEFTKYLLRGYDRLAFVDHSSESNTSILPTDIYPNIIIDHHPKMGDFDAAFEDVRTSIGSVSTIMTQYLDDLDIDIDSRLATALMYGIMTDTNYFKRKFSKDDVDAVSILKTKVDPSVLTQIESPTISPDVLDVIGKSVLGREVVSGYVLSNVGYISNRDSLPQAAEFLLNLEGAKTVLVYGMLKDALYISARTKDVKLNLGQAMDKAFGSIGSAGGHMASAAAKIPLGIFGMVDDKEILKSLVGEAIKKMFFRTVGIY